MRSENERAAALLHGVADAIPVEPPPLGILLRSGRRARRRRSLGVLASVAAAVLLVGGGTTWAVTGLHLSPSAGGPTNTGRISPPSKLSAPPFTRLVGVNGVGVAVPEGWSTNDGWCYSAQSDTVLVGRVGGGDCNLVSADVSSVDLEPYTFAASYRLAWHPTGRLKGVPITRTSVRVAPCNFTSCHMYSAALLVKSMDAVVYVSSPHRATVGRILDSAFLIPSGYVAVPAAQTQRALRQQGFVVRVRLVYRPALRQGTVIGTSPVSGSVVAHGSTITLAQSTNRHGAGCGNLQISLVAPKVDRQLFWQQLPRPVVRLDVPAGARIRVATLGQCAGQVDVSMTQTPQPGGSRVLHEQPTHRLFIAGSPGTAAIVLTLSTCAGTGDSLCAGGFFVLATVKVRVDPGH